MNLAEDIAAPGHNLRDALDIELEESLSDFRAQFNARKGEAERAVVTNEDEAGRATALIGVLMDIESDTEKKRVELKAPFLTSGRKVDSTYSSFAGTVAAARGKVFALLDAYRKEQRRLAAEEQAKLAREAAAKEEQARAAAAAGRHVEAARLETQAAVAADRAQAVSAPQAIRPEYGQVASGRTEWKFEVLDRKKLPKAITTHPKVIEAQDAVIASMVRAGTREIAGTRIYPEEKTVVRR